MSTGDGFGVDTGGLAARADEFAALADRARAVVRRLAEELDAVPAPWGGDAVGRGFAAAHGEPAARARELLEHLPGEFERFGGTLAEAATAYESAESGAAEAVREAGRAG
ncbi:PE domain-containing protein [Saccharomonospora piscinae]|uniref:PE domain-containing protein n=1 Tax=Saccharomonospora piscinae TaxID=687388 RepID=UPI000466139B|nr:PE domain-containing protein [Saccharomonospora piscinae]